MNTKSPVTHWQNYPRNSGVTSCLTYSLHTCTIKSFLFVNTLMRIFFFFQLIISLLHSTTWIAYYMYIKPFKKMNYVSTKNSKNKSYTCRVKPYLCDHFSVIIFVKISTSVKKKTKIINMHNCIWYHWYLFMINTALSSTKVHVDCHPHLYIHYPAMILHKFTCTGTYLIFIKIFNKIWRMNRNL